MAAAKRFSGLDKEERRAFEKLIIALAFKYSEESETYEDKKRKEKRNNLSNDGNSLKESLKDLVGATKKLAEQKEGKSVINMEEAYNKSPKYIKSILDQYIIGQDEAKRILAVAFFNHVRRINAFDIAQSLGKEKDFAINKSNAIILGPTGTGKTYLIEILAKIFNLPFCSADASTITQAGFVGKSAHEVIEQLYLQSGKDIKKTERGIVFLDEIDKLATTKEGKQNSMVEGAQQSLLKMVEGTDVEIDSGGPDKSKKIMINTRNILFVFAGAFVGLIGDNKKKHISIIEENQNLNTDNSIKKVVPDDLVKYGIIPELIGRVSLIAQMHPLSKDHLISILQNSKNNVIEQYSNMFEHDKIKINFDEGSYESIAEKAVELKTGARSLRSIIDYLMVDKIYDIETEGENKTTDLSITTEYVKEKLKNFNKVNE